MSLISILQPLLEPLAPGGAWPMVAAQGTAAPYIVFQRVGSGVLNIIDGPPPLDNTDMQIDVYACTYESALSVAAAIDDTLQAAAQAGTFGCYAIVSPRDLFESDTRLYRVLMEYSFWTA